MLRRAISLAFIVGFGGFGVVQASAQTGLSFEISNVISPNKPSATLEVWAYFEEQPFAFAAAEFDVAAAHDEGGFSDPFAILHTLGTFDGEVELDGDSVTGCLAGQIQAPVGEWYADQVNPILIWRVTWSTSDFTPRTVDVSTLTSRYAIYLDFDGNSVLVDGTLEAVGSITVVPAPGAVGGAMVGGLVLRRRR